MAKNSENTGGAREKQELPQLDESMRTSYMTDVIRRALWEKTGEHKAGNDSSLPLGKGTEDANGKNLRRRGGIRRPKNEGTLSKQAERDTNLDTRPIEEVGHDIGDNSSTRDIQRVVGDFREKIERSQLGSNADGPNLQMEDPMAKADIQKRQEYMDRLFALQLEKKLNGFSMEKNIIRRQEKVLDNHARKKEESIPEKKGVLDHISDMVRNLSWKKGQERKSFRQFCERKER